MHKKKPIVPTRQDPPTTAPMGINEVETLKTEVKRLKKENSQLGFENKEYDEWVEHSLKPEIERLKHKLNDCPYRDVNCEIEQQCFKESEDE